MPAPRFTVRHLLNLTAVVAGACVVYRIVVAGGDAVALIIGFYAVVILVAVQRFFRQPR